MTMAIYILACVCGLLAAYIVGKWAFGKDTEIENRRRAAAKLATIMKTWGLQRIPDFLVDYSVGDYSGMAHRIKMLVELFVDGEQAVTSEFKQIYNRVLDAQLKTPEGLALLEAKLNEAKKAKSTAVTV